MAELRGLPVDPMFENKIVELYRDMIVHSDLPMSCSQGDRMAEVKRRFQIYWTFHAMEEKDEQKASNWVSYVDQCLASPLSLDWGEVDAMQRAIEEIPRFS